MISSPPGIYLLQKSATWVKLFDREGNDKRCFLFWRTFGSDAAAVTLDNFAANS